MRLSIMLFFAVLLIGAGCTRAKYFAQADAEAKQIVAEKSRQNAWDIGAFEVAPDPRSRYRDVYCEVHPPIPQDDAQSARYMQSVDGHRGDKHWYRDGQRQFLENPGWQADLSSYSEVNEQGEVVLSLLSAIEIARVNSPAIQRQIETVYLSALDVSAERFEFDTQYFAGNETTFSHLGRLRNPVLGERNELRSENDALLRRRFTTAGELLVGLANTIVWQFAGSDSNQAFSLVNFTFVQPLLRGAYRSVAMEDLTQSERTMLANLRALERYYQGFLTNLAVGELGVLGPVRTPGNPAAFPGDVDAAIRLETIVTQAESPSVIAPNRALTTGFVTSTGAPLNGFLGLLQQLQVLRNSRQNLSAQERALQLLEAHLAAGNIELIRVDEFRQSVQVERNNVLNLETRLQSALDDFKVDRLGIPAVVPMTLDDRLLQGVNLNTEPTLKLQSDSQWLLDRVRSLLDGATAAEANEFVGRLQSGIGDAQAILTGVQQLVGSANEQTGMQEDLPVPTPLIGDRPQQVIAEVLERIQQRLDDLGQQVEGFSSTDPMPPAASSSLSRCAQELAEISDLIYLAEVRVRMANVLLPMTQISPPDALGIAGLNRLDWMNARASLVDQWRQISLQANRLKSDMDIFVSGDLGTVGNNPAKFRGPTGTVRLGVRFDGALTRRLERNAFRESIIEYQRARRDLIQFQDRIGKNLRRILREMEQLERSLEIQRRGVEIAVRRVDVSLQTLNRPPVPAPPGAPNNQLSPNAAFSMLTALGDLRASKDNVLNVWLNYQAARLLLARELGVIGLEFNEFWLDPDRPLHDHQILGELEWLPPEVLWEELPADADPLDVHQLDSNLFFHEGELFADPSGARRLEDASDSAVQEVELLQLIGGDGMDGDGIGQ